MDPRQLSRKSHLEDTTSNGEAFAMLGPGEATLYSSWLEKRGLHIPTWRRRYFVLKASGDTFELQYFRKQPAEGDRPTGVLDVVAITPGPNDDIIMQTVDSMYMLRAESTAERGMFVAKIQRALDGNVICEPMSLADLPRCQPHPFTCCCESHKHSHSGDPTSRLLSTATQRSHSGCSQGIFGNTQAASRVKESENRLATLSENTCKRCGIVLCEDCGWDRVLDIRTWLGQRVCKHCFEVSGRINRVSGEDAVQMCVEKIMSAPDTDPCQSKDELRALIDSAKDTANRLGLSQPFPSFVPSLQNAPARKKSVTMPHVQMPSFRSLHLSDCRPGEQLESILDNSLDISLSPNKAGLAADSSGNDDVGLGPPCTQFESILDTSLESYSSPAKLQEPKQASPEHPQTPKASGDLTPLPEVGERIAQEPQISPTNTANLQLKVHDAAKEQGKPPFHLHRRNFNSFTAGCHSHGLDSRVDSRASCRSFGGTQSSTRHLGSNHLPRLSRAGSGSFGSGGLYCARLPSRRSSASYGGPPSDSSGRGCRQHQHSYSAASAFFQDQDHDYDCDDEHERECELHQQHEHAVDEFRGQMDELRSHWTCDPQRQKLLQQVVVLCAGRQPSRSEVDLAVRAGVAMGVEAWGMDQPSYAQHVRMRADARDAARRDRELSSRMASVIGAPDDENVSYTQRLLGRDADRLRSQNSWAGPVDVLMRPAHQPSQFVWNMMRAYGEIQKEATRTESIDLHDADDLMGVWMVVVAKAIAKGCGGWSSLSMAKANAESLSLSSAPACTSGCSRAASVAGSSPTRKELGCRKKVSARSRCHSTPDGTGAREQARNAPEFYQDPLSYLDFLCEHEGYAGMRVEQFEQMLKHLEQHDLLGQAPGSS